MATDSIPYEAFRNNLRAVMARIGLTQQELEKLTGIDQGEISKVLNGKRDLRFSTAHKYAEAVGVDYHKLVDPEFDVTTIPASTKITA